MEAQTTGMGGALDACVFCGRQVVRGSGSGWWCVHCSCGMSEPMVRALYETQEAVPEVPLVVVEEYSYRGAYCSPKQNPDAYP